MILAGPRCVVEVRVKVERVSALPSKRSSSHGCDESDRNGAKTTEEGQEGARRLGGWGTHKWYLLWPRGPIKISHLSAISRARKLIYGGVVVAPTAGHHRVRSTGRIHTWIPALFTRVQQTCPAPQPRPPHSTHNHFRHTTAHTRPPQQHRQTARIDKDSKDGHLHQHPPGAPRAPSRDAARRVPPLPHPRRAPPPPWPTPVPAANGSEQRYSGPWGVQAVPARAPAWAARGLWWTPHGRVPRRYGRDQERCACEERAGEMTTKLPTATVLVFIRRAGHLSRAAALFVALLCLSPPAVHKKSLSEVVSLLSHTTLNQHVTTTVLLYKSLSTCSVQLTVEIDCCRSKCETRPRHAVKAHHEPHIGMFHHPDVGIYARQPSER